MDEQQSQSVVDIPANDQMVSPVVPPEGAPKGKSKKGFIVLGVVVVVLAVGGVFAYRVYAQPAMVWKKFMNHPVQPGDAIVHEDFNFSYQDNGELSADQLKSNPYASMLSKIKFSVSGNAYINATDPNNTDTQGDITYSFGSGSTSFSAELQAILKGQDAYVKLGDVPFIGGALTGLNDGKKVDWVKVNFHDLAEEVKTEGDSTMAMPDFKQEITQYQAIVTKDAGKLITVDKVLGRETIHGVQTIHYSNKGDKVELKAMLNEIFTTAVDQAQKMDASTSPEDIAKAKDLAQTIVNGLVDRVQVKTFETWIGVSDSKLYKLSFSTSAPSIVSFVSAADATKDETDPQQIATDVLNKISFDGTFSLTEEFSDYGKKQDVAAPANALDLVQKIKDEKQKGMPGLGGTPNLMQ